MPDLNDFHAFISTGGGSYSGGGPGCSGSFWAVVVIAGLLMLLGKCCGQ